MAEMAFCKPDFITQQLAGFSSVIYNNHKKKGTTHQALEDKKITIQKKTHNFVIQIGGI
jgi:hypothetical protein